MSSFPPYAVMKLNEKTYLDEILASAGKAAIKYASNIEIQNKMDATDGSKTFPLCLENAIYQFQSSKS